MKIIFIRVIERLVFLRFSLKRMEKLFIDRYGIFIEKIDFQFIKNESRL
ncbi:hypothetical protein LEP1GSC107_1528 [Leptospira interrogans serovar Grippotyphosa str. UI 12769]|uniref:Uncharacterized protein n=1 Tax=Leptospira interrogans str. UI 12621 TaxID=1049937 RepID=A0A0F6H6C6_LEPIR|nr:hypothetical protein LEP1GSC014_2021 [Leptospira interrogans serovar Pomona str. Pomona]EKO23776.1 hypothetical protein LEP1GSC104_2200 [Leptospira interrogans str. UI 12621]EKO67851.1 hypothetical protein LEP1GSC069_1301 [Leptospira interrogans serovar Canicola str. Fiocruz LV133]EKR43881.1 hypothetical protein LEP1GSC097_1095 [Leptospira interrogans serovar Grippotyphosa str. UI 08368]EMF31519.1 hypothetical protein LEP1GSC201_1679 [Leptospira interrogans serovar Pomona str. Fox 32256]EMI